MNIGDMPCREKYWEEKDPSQKIEKLAEAVEGLHRRICQLEKENSLLSTHSHDNSGDIVVPLFHNEPEQLFYVRNILGRESK